MIIVFSCGLAAGMFILLELGRWLGQLQLSRRTQTPQNVSGVVDAAVFGLMGLLIAFTFSGAATRWEWRRGLIVQEANAIGTAYLRLDLLPPAAQPELRDTFRRYVRSRLAIYEKMPEVDATKTELQRSASLQQKLWHQAVAAVKDAGSPAVMTLVLSNLNEMIDITTTRAAALQAHLPRIVFLMLSVTILVSSLLAGYNMAATERSWVHLVSYTLLLSVAVFLILELEYPRIGYVRIDAADNLLVQELEKMQ